MLQARILVFGAVQGVGYRAFVATIAHDLKINGKVKNLLDGRVEIVCECPSEAVFSEFVRLLNRRDGFIHVEKIAIAEKGEIKKPAYTWFYVDH